jgi:aminoglycoside 6'-N-acetyltransferase I
VAARVPGDLQAAVKTVRHIQAADRREWVRMRCALWPDEPEEELATELEGWLARGFAILVSPRHKGGLDGFVEVSIRNYAEGCATDRVAYIEAWYVDEDRRGRGIGRALIAAAEAWARTQQCRELASDAKLTNAASHRAHERLGFVEQERIVCYKKLVRGAS